MRMRTFVNRPAKKTRAELQAELKAAVENTSKPRSNKRSKSMVGHGFGGEEMRMQESMREFREAEERKAVAKMTDGYNCLRDALVWFDTHDVEIKLGHLPQWVVAARRFVVV